MKLHYMGFCCGLQRGSLFSVFLVPLYVNYLNPNFNKPSDRTDQRKHSQITKERRVGGDHINADFNPDFMKRMKSWRRSYQKHSLTAYTHKMKHVNADKIM